MMYQTYLYGLGAVTCFSISSLFFTIAGKKTSAYFTNFFKASVAFIAFGLALLISSNPVLFSFQDALRFGLSGFLGLALGDILLLSAFSLIGPGRTLVIFGFQPVIMSLVGYFFLNQGLPLKNIYAIACFLGCLFLFSIEQFKQNKSFGVKGILYALVAVSLDSSGIIITRAAFDASPWVSTQTGNFLRVCGALVGYFFLHFLVKKIEIKNFLKQLNPKEIRNLTIGSFLGTFCSLSLYLAAIRSANLATLTALTLTTPLLTTILEKFIFKKPLTTYIYASFALFILGIGIIFLL